MKPLSVFLSQPAAPGIPPLHCGTLTGQAPSNEDQNHLKRASGHRNFTDFIFQR